MAESYDKENAMKFSKSQILLLINMQDTVRMSQTNNEYYAETGKCKPFSKATINALVKKDFIKVVRTACSETIFYCTPSSNFSLVPILTWNDYNKAK